MSLRRKVDKKTNIETCNLTIVGKQLLQTSFNFVKIKETLR